MAFLGPIAASVVATRVVNQWLPRSTTLVGQILLWGLLSLVAIATLYVTDKAARKLLPLAALLQLAVIFPDQAPSRYRVALRTGTVHQLEAQVASIKRSGLSDDKTEAAEQLIELVAALSAHDRLTRGHAERVRAYCRLIGEELGLDDDDLSKLQWAGLLHDVGKLFVPAEILNKPSSLTDHEFGIIMRHPGWGAELCEPLRPWLGDWVDAVGQHHEWWNGHGYPNGLAGEEISLAARIVSVADVFDVITSVRSYKKPEGVVAARAELTRCAGTQFEPRIVRAFLTVSLGRLRLLMGPLSSLANLPTLARLPLAGASTAASGAITAGALMFGGLLNDPDPPKPTPQAEPAPLAPPSTTPPTTPPTTQPPPPPEDPPEPPDPVIKPPGDEVAPVAEADTAMVSEDGSILVDVLANDRGASIVTWVGTPEAGSTTIVDGRVRFVAAPEQEGTVTFSYGVESPSGKASTGTVSIVVQPVNDPPTFQAGRLVEVAQDAGPQQITGWATEVRPGPANESGQRVGFTAVTADASLFSGLPWVDETGTLRFTPAADASGTTTVTVTAVDDGGTAFGGDNESAPHLLTITVAAVNRRPVARDDTARVAEDGTVTIPVLANDTDGDGDRLSVTVAAPMSTGTVSTNGTTVTYRPAPDSNGTHTFSYRVSDGALTDTATITVTVVPVNDAPVAVDDTATVAEDGTVTIAVLSNDTDRDGNPLTVTSATSGTGTVSTDGATVTYAPALDSTGTKMITYTISDGALTDTATVKVTVTPLNDAPVAGDDTATVAEDGTVTISVLGNDADPDGDPLTVTVAGPISTGTVTTDGTTVTYTPAPDTNGTHTLTYRVFDGALADTATITVTVVPASDAPVAVDDTATVGEDGTVTIAVLSNDVDPDGDPLAVTSASSSTGTASTDGNTVTYTPAPNSIGTHTITYTVSDGALADTATITVTVTPVNDAPVAVDDTATLAEDGTVTISVLGNDADPDGDPLTVTVAAPSPTGTATTDGTAITYMPAPDSNGTHTMTYTVSDGALADTATITVTVTPVNDAPSFTSGANVTIPEDSPAQSLAWATGVTPGPADEAAQMVTFTATTDDDELFEVLPAVDTSGTLTFTPAADAVGTAAVQVTLRDDGGTDNGGTDSSPPHVLRIRLTPMPDAPQATDDAYVTSEGTPLWVGPWAGVLSNDSDEDGDSLRVAALATPPTSGNLLLVPHGGFIYVPLPGFTGQDTFTYTVTDGVLTDTGTVTVLVAASSSQTYYLATSGAGRDNWDLVTSVPPDPGPDVDGDGNPGLTVKDSNQTLTEIDPAKYQQWRLVTPTDLTLTGPITLGLWSTAKDFGPNDDIDYSVWVQDCAADGTGCVTIARSVNVHVNDWNGGLSDWVYRDITVGWANHTITAGRMLQVRVMFDHHDVWIATDPAMASTLSFNQS